MKIAHTGAGEICNCARMLSKAARPGFRCAAIIWPRCGVYVIKVSGVSGMIIGLAAARESFWVGICAFLGERSLLIVA